MITDFWDILADESDTAAAWLLRELVISEGCLSVGSGQRLCNGVCEKAYQWFYDSDEKNRILIQILSSAFTFCFIW